MRQRDSMTETETEQLEKRPALSVSPPIFSLFLTSSAPDPTSPGLILTYFLPQAQPAADTNAKANTEKKKKKKKAGRK